MSARKRRQSDIADATKGLNRPLFHGEDACGRTGAADPESTAMLAAGRGRKSGQRGNIFFLFYLGVQRGQDGEAGPDSGGGARAEDACRAGKLPQLGRGLQSDGVISKGAGVCVFVLGDRILTCPLLSSPLPRGAANRGFNDGEATVPLSIHRRLHS